jgi:hypothetical protein
MQSGVTYQRQHCTIEDLAEKGKEKDACPFFTACELAKNADMRTMSCRMERRCIPWTVDIRKRDLKG